MDLIAVVLIATAAAALVGRRVARVVRGSATRGSPQSAGCAGSCPGCALAPEQPCREADRAKPS